ncbi:MAG TPA: hypothetical protein DDY52_03295 [Candidatus Moranbacteria bacterium]|nr:hypothetical protein [Candidatus Moranbacteria bacterium]
MSEKISRDTLSHGDKKLIEDVLKKTPHELTNQDKKILRARRNYLSAVEEEVFGKVLNEDVEVKTEKPVKTETKKETKKK